MNRTLLSAALPALLTGFAAAAPVVIPSAGLVYAQNFNTLATAANNGNATTPWADDSTLPGWFLYRAGNGTPPGFAGASYVYRVADGSAAPSVGIFHSMGAAGNTDRALGSPSTTGQGELSAIAVFQNTSSTPMELTRLKHHVEVRRANDGANNVETVFVWWRTADSLAEIKAITTAPATTAVFSGGVSTSPSAHYITGWNRLTGAEYPYSNSVASQVVNVSNPVDIVPDTAVRVAAGQFFAIRYSNINDAGGDALMGIDDVELTFSPIAAAMDAAVSDIVRQNSGTPGDPLDDTVDFTLTASGVGNVSPDGWIVQFPPSIAGRTGAYNIPQRITGVPLSDFSGSGHATDLYVEDRANPALWDISQVTAPWTQISAAISDVTRDDRGTPDNPYDDLWGYSVFVDGAFGGAVFTSDNSSIPDSPYGTSHTVSELPIDLGFQSTIFSDTYDSLVTATVTAYAPRILGVKDFGTPAPLFSGGEGVTGGWLLDESLLTQTMNNGGGGTRRTFSTEAVNVAGTGGVKFSARIRAVDTSSGFEAGDTLTAQLIIDGSTVVNLITAYDTNRNGVMNGGSGTADDEFNAPKTSDGSYSSNFPVTYIVPSTATTAQFVVSGINDSGSETLIVQDIRFETGGDTDGDGMPDLYEDSNGLKKNDPGDRDLDRDGDGQSNYLEFVAGTAAGNSASTLKITGQQWGEGEITLTWLSVPGKTYRIEHSSDMTVWEDMGNDYSASAGPQTTASVPTGAEPAGAHFYRILVKPAGP